MTTHAYTAVEEQALEIGVIPGGHVVGFTLIVVFFRGLLLRSDSPWDRLEQCAYFIRMAALLRLSSVYEDVPRRAGTKDEFELVTPSLASRANLTLVSIDDPSACAPSGGTAHSTSTITTSKRK
ncbi:hypothetical protein HPB50_026218 [Hyalomma asiaticum]|uniref:Uncharacterized protein n=1 Tax=Hyalomma asiaticum TaxID=266040 RepID=A0ACB7S5Y0_HYAAI|nr:hypothetical protein HPB50_026218 [Hyalomma asiaticum]